MWDGFWFVANKKHWDGLPADLQAIVSRNVNMRGRRAARRHRAVSTKSLEGDLRKHGMVFNDVDVASLREGHHGHRLLHGMEGQVRRRGMGPAAKIYRTGRLMHALDDAAGAPAGTLGTLRWAPLRLVDAGIGKAVELFAAVLVVAEIVDPAVRRRRPLRASTRRSSWSDELASILFLWLAMLGAVIALRRGEHMRMTALVNAARRVNAQLARVAGRLVAGDFLLHRCSPPALELRERRGAA